MTTEQQIQEVITRETLELIAQQTITTQLVIILIVVIVVGGIIALFTLRGGLSVFKNLSASIYKLSEIETERHKTQGKTVEAVTELTAAVSDLTERNEKRYDKIDLIWSDVRDGLSDVATRVVALQEMLKNNPKEHKEVLEALNKLNQTLKETKVTTDKLDPNKVSQ